MEQIHSSGWAYRVHELSGTLFPEVSGGYGVYLLPTDYRPINLYLSDDVLYEIFGSTRFYYSAGSLVEQFGAPEGLVLMQDVQGRYKGTCSNCEGWEMPTEPTIADSSAFFLYPSQGLWFWVSIPARGLGCICSDMEVGTFRYYSPGSMQEALDTYNVRQALMYPAIEIKEITQEDIVKWHGFGGDY